MKAVNPTDTGALIRFSTCFVIIAGLLYLLFNTMPAAWLAQPLIRYTAETTAFLLQVAGLDASVSGILVSLSGFTVKIIPECTVIFLAILFVSFVIAYPTSPKNKLLGLAFGLPFLVSVNLLRLAFIIVVGGYSRTLFDYAHVYIGQIAMMLVLLVTCIMWLRYIARVHMEDNALRFCIRFIGYSSIPFVIWLYVDQFFVFANLYVVKGLLSLVGLDMAVPAELNLYPHTFNTFHLIAFTSLILATESLEKASKIRSLVFGLSILLGFHFLFRLHQVMFLDFHMAFAKHPFVALIIINQWLLPFGLWLFLVRNALFKRKDRFICPICGEEKAGLAEHIKAKHNDVPMREIKALGV
jgi:exosortase H (IPTLxxWG-CTERM-specific)